MCALRAVLGFMVEAGAVELACMIAMAEGWAGQGARLGRTKILVIILTQQRRAVGPHNDFVVSPPTESPNDHVESSFGAGA